MKIITEMKHVGSEVDVTFKIQGVTTEQQADVIEDVFNDIRNAMSDGRITIPEGIEIALEASRLIRM